MSARRAMRPRRDMRRPQRSGNRPRLLDSRNVARDRAPRAAPDRHGHRHGKGRAAPFRVVDLFSGAGGMSYGFAAHPQFEVIGAADAQRGKPSSAPGSLGCNASYAANIGVRPIDVDLAAATPAQLRAAMGVRGSVDVLLACPPCTGFSRAVSRNHLVDDARNSLVGRVADFAAELRPSVIIMENARELVIGRFSHHLSLLSNRLAELGYVVDASCHLLNRFGLPQRRERAVIIAVRGDLRLRTLDDLWEGRAIEEDATQVRRAIWDLPALAEGERDPRDPMHVAPRFASAATRQRMAAIPRDGGSWTDLIGGPCAERLLTPAMRARARAGSLGSHPDVYGRMAWDRSAPTIKRECAHVGNGRYAHPEQNRLASVREMGILQGFPRDYTFCGTSLGNMYRHIGDAVPPLISYQLAWLASWSLTGSKPDIGSILLPGTHLLPDDVRAAAAETRPAGPHRRLTPSLR